MALILLLCMLMKIILIDVRLVYGMLLIVAHSISLWVLVQCQSGYSTRIKQQNTSLYSDMALSTNRGRVFVFVDGLWIASERV